MFILTAKVTVDSTAKAEMNQKHSEEFKIKIENLIKFDDFIDFKYVQNVIDVKKYELSLKIHNSGKHMAVLYNDSISFFKGSLSKFNSQQISLQKDTPILSFYSTEPVDIGFMVNEQSEVMLILHQLVDFVEYEAKISTAKKKFNILIVIQLLKVVMITLKYITGTIPVILLNISLLDLLYFYTGVFFFNKLNLNCNIILNIRLKHNKIKFQIIFDVAQMQFILVFDNFKGISFITKVKASQNLLHASY